jgi:hypothetical protein
MTGEQTLLARTAVGTVGAIAGVLLVSTPRLRTIPNQLFNRLAVGSLVVSRLGLFAFVFFLLHLQARGDVGYYWSEGLSAMRGELPYRDFTSSYAPLHPYFDSLAIRVWHSQLALILLAILAEFALLPLWLSVGRRLFPEQELRVASLLYLTSPMSLIFVCIDGQDNVVIAMLLAAALALLLRRSEALSGAAVAFALSAVKILPLLFTPIFFFATPRRWRWAAGAIVVAGLVYGTGLALHLPITQPLTNEGAIRTAGNLPFVIESAANRLYPSRLWDSLVLASLAGIVLFVARTVRGQSEATRLRVITFAMSAIILTLVVISKKGWPNYLMLVLFPVCLLARRFGRAGIVVFSLFGILGVVEHSFWSSLLIQPGAIDFHAWLFHPQLSPHGRVRPPVLVVLELLLIAGYGWLLGLSLREIAAAPHQMATARDNDLNRLPV